MSGAGLSPFGTGPFGLPSVDALSDTDGQFVSSRFIQSDGTPRQTDDGTGAFVGMSDAMQRVLILTAYGVQLPESITATTEHDLRASVETSLEPLTAQPNPQVELVGVDYADNGGSFVGVQIRVRDLTDGGRVHTFTPSGRSR